MADKGKTPHRWFLKDDPVGSTEQDHFGHGAYTEVLADAILNAEPPFTIGVFGEWGVGKTTISKDSLEAALGRKAKAKVAFAYFDVWKYEEDSLRRQFLRDVAQQLNAAGQLTRYDPETRLRDLVEDLTETVDRGLHFAWQRLPLAIIRFVLGALVMFGALRLADQFGWLAEDATATNDLAIALITGLTLSVLSELGRVIFIGQPQVTIKSIDAPDLFEKKFKELMDHVKSQRVVIVFDNLDRCAPDRVVEVLSTIKTFLEPSGAERHPIFVIPCDRAAIRRHLVSRESSVDGLDQAGRDADEYLRKFFNAALPINPILEEEIRIYISGQLEDLELREGLDDDQLTELTQVISVAFRHNPRRVKQFLNTLTAKLMLIRQREQSGIINPPISQEVAFLAKLTVIEEEWPDFYQAIQDDSRTFDSLSLVAVRSTAAGSDKIADFKKEPLLAFLRGTRRTRSTNIRAFTRLKLAPIELRIPDFQEYRSALLDGRREAISELLADLPEESLKEYQDALLDVLRFETTQGYFENALNVADAAIMTEPLRSKRVAVEVAERLYSQDQLRALLPSLVPLETLQVLDLADTDASRMLILEYLELLKRTDLQPLIPNEELPAWQTQVARGLMAIRERLDPKEKTTIKNLARDPLSQNIDFLREMAIAEDGPQQFLTPKVFEVVAERLTLDQLKLDDAGALELEPTLEVLLKLLDIAEQPGISLFLQKTTSFLASMPADVSAPGRDGLMELLRQTRHKIAMADQASATSLSDALRNAYSYTAQPHRWKIISVLAALYPLLPSAHQTEIQNLLVQFVSSEPLIGGVGPFLGEEANRGLDQLPQPVLDSLLANLRQRFRTSGTPSDSSIIAAAFITHSDQIGEEQLQNLLLEPVDAASPQPVISAITDHKERLVEKHREALLAVLSRICDTLSSYTPDALPGPYEIVWLLADVVDDEIRGRVRDHLVSLLTSHNAPSREAALRLLEEAESRKVIRDAERRHIVEQVVAWIATQIDSLDSMIEPLLVRVARDIPVAEEVTQDTAVNALKAMLPKEPPLRDIAARYLVQITPTERRAEVAEELVQRARQEIEVPRRHIFCRYAFELAGDDRRKKERRIIDAYLDELIRSPEEADQQFVKQLRGE